MIKKNERCSSPTYITWASMLARVSNPKMRIAKYYIGRGITVCDRWRVYENFLADMGTRPDGKSLDRIDNDGNYEPGNCRWATQSEQCSNKRTTRRIEIGGQNLTLKEWGDLSGLGDSLIFYRLKRGWSPYDSITIPASLSNRKLRRQNA